MKKTRGKHPYSLRLRRKGDLLVAEGVLRLTPDLAVRAWASVDQRQIRDAVQRLQSDGEPIIGSIFSDIWDGAKDIAKKVTQSSLLRKVANTLTDPRFQGLLSIVPGVGPIAAHATAQVGAAWNGLRAATASANGLSDVASQISAWSGQQAAALGLGPEQFNAAQRYGASLAVDPAAMAVVQQQIPGGLQSLIRTYSAGPEPVPPGGAAAFSAPTPASPVPHVQMPPGTLEALRKGPPGATAPAPVAPAPAGPPPPKQPSLPPGAIITTKGTVTTPEAAALGVVSLSPKQLKHLATPETYTERIKGVKNYGMAAQLLRGYLLQNAREPAAWGVYGPSAAVVRFQRFTAIPVTGRVDAQTYKMAEGSQAKLPQPAFLMPGQ